MKHLKYKVSRSTLEKMYFVFVRPIMEYADIVWAGAHTNDLVKLNRLQVEAMRIVTGATAKSNIMNLYRELNWPFLSERRNTHSIVISNI